MRTLLEDDRGIALIDLLVACAILTMIVLASSIAYGMRPARTHAAAIALEGALAEARILAAASGDVSNPAYPSGATVVVESDPEAAADSRISVFRSRPVRIGGAQPSAPSADSGFPPKRVRGTFSFLGNAAPIHEPFAIMLSSGGYASIEQLTSAYNETQPATYETDPGCPSATASIEVADGASTESHSFGCTGGIFVAN